MDAPSAHADTTSADTRLRSLSRQRTSPVEIGLRLLLPRLDPERRAKMLRRNGVFLLERQRDTPVELRVCIIRPNEEGRLIVRNGLVQSAGPDQGIAPIHVRIRRVRIQLERDAVLRD